MERLPSKTTNQIQGEKHSTFRTFCGKYRVFAAFIICLAILTAGFAIGGILSGTEMGRAFAGRLNEWLSMQTDEQTQSTDPTTEEPTESPKDPPLLVPENAIPVIGMDLSCLSRGEGYFLNETDYLPNFAELAEKELDLLGDAPHGSAPLVLIVHTHTIESYLEDGATFVEGGLSEETFSDASECNVLAVGRVLAEVLTEKGIPTLHCTVDHTSDGMLQGAYERAAHSIESYRKLYPSIQLVIDLHRDAVLTADGEYIKSETPNNEGFAQIMPVVGSDRNGTLHPRWEENLTLAVRLRGVLNTFVEGICRPVYIRSSSYNQELAPYALLLEIGTGGNSLEEAKRTARVLGDALYVLFNSGQGDQ